MRWLRLYDTVLDDPKVQRLAPELFKAWVNLLCVACRKDGTIPAHDLGFMLRVDDATAERWVSELEAAGLIDQAKDGTRRPHDWAEYQFVSDRSTDRVREHRQRKAAASNGHDPEPNGGGKVKRLRNVSRNVAPETAVNALESESESESETLDSDSDSDGKVAVGPWKRPATLPDDGARLAAARKVETFFADAPADRDRILAAVRNPRLVPDPGGYVDACIANAVRLRRKRKPRAAPAAAAPPATAVNPVWVRVGTPAWDAWNRVDPQRALESKHHPGEVGRWRPTELPPQREAVA